MQPGELVTKRLHGCDGGRLPQLPPRDEGRHHPRPWPFRGREPQAQVARLRQDSRRHADAAAGQIGHDLPLGGDLRGRAEAGAIDRADQALLRRDYEVNIPEGGGKELAPDASQAISRGEVRGEGLGREEGFADRKAGHACLA